MIFGSEGSEQHKLLEYKRLDALIGYCETSACRRLALLSYFDEAIKTCGNCDNCIQPPKLEDCSDVAKTLITAVKETGQYFGVSHIIDVVRGAETAKVKARSHNLLEVFGIAASQPKQILQSIIRQLIANGALRVNLEKYGALEVSEKGYNILRGNEKFMSKTVSKVTSSSPKESWASSPSTIQNNSELFAELKKLRLELAQERSVPAYVIFSDKTLNQIANDMPTNQNQFLAVNGVGRIKLEEFYQSFQEVISKFSNSKNNI